MKGKKGRSEKESRREGRKRGKGGRRRIGNYHVANSLQIFGHGCGGGLQERLEVRRRGYVGGEGRGKQLLDSVAQYLFQKVALRFVVFLSIPFYLIFPPSPLLSKSLNCTKSSQMGGKGKKE